MAASLGFPFTSAQWKELERQAMIYKYMMASVPVPPELLMPITRNFSESAASPHSTLGRGSIFNLRFSNGADPEPGRCRRTDGKKWRCSRDVALNQKYCERHMHRGRPRSRKPVEVHADVNSSHKKTRHCHALPATPATLSSPMLTNTSCSQSQYLGSALDPRHQSPVFLYKSDSKASPFTPLVSVPSFKETRSLEWMAKGEAAPMATSDQQWQQLMQTKIGLTIESSSSICNSNASVFNQQYQEEPINLNSYTDFSAGADNPGRDSINMFLNPGVISLQKPQTETPRAFIDAWSSAVTENPANTCNKSSVSSNGKLPLSSLTLSMGGDNGIEDEMGRTEMGLRIVDSGGGGCEKPQLSTWLTPASWAGLAPGGPLAEVLRPSSVAAASNPASPHGGNGDSISLSETAASSPSGVLQKPVVSPSDSSGNSSPTLTASPAKPEITFPWLNQSKVASAE